MGQNGTGFRFAPNHWSILPQLKIAYTYIVKARLK